MKELNVEILEELLDTKNYKEIKNLCDLYPEVDLAEVCDEIEDKKKLIPLFKIIKADYTAELFSYLRPDTQEEIISIMSNKDIDNLLENSFTDDIVDFLEDMPANITKKVLQRASKEDRAIINKLLNYKENTAGSIMTTEYLEFYNTRTIDETIKLIRERGKDAETIYTLFVVDSKRNFIGTADLDDLIFAEPNQTLNDIVNKDFQTVDVNMDQEEVAEIVRRYNLNAIAVLNESKRLAGIITVDDIVDVIQEEANEDISLQAGVTPLEEGYINTSIFKMAFKCIPWLMFLLVIDVFSSMVMSRFQDTLSLFAILAAFTPTIMDTGGNAGSQTSALMVRSIALNEFEKKESFKILWKEFRTGIIVAIITALFGFVWFMVEMYIGLVVYPVAPEGVTYVAGEIFLARLGISALVSITLLVTIIIAKFIGCLLPLIVNAINKDPALVCGPFITSLVDVSSLLIYFGVFSILRNFIPIL